MTFLYWSIDNFKSRKMSLDKCHKVSSKVELTLNQVVT